MYIKPYNTWTVFADVTEAFLPLANAPLNISDNIFDLLQKLVALIYDKAYELSWVNEARQHTLQEDAKL